MANEYPWQEPLPRNRGVNAYPNLLPRTASKSPSRASTAIAAYPSNNRTYQSSLQPMYEELGLAGTAAPTVTSTPLSSKLLEPSAQADPLNTQVAETRPDWRTLYESKNKEYEDLFETSQREQTKGPSAWAANTAAIGGLGLGIASYFDTKKTAKLQRQALSQDISAARENNERRKALGDSWNKAWS